MNILLAPVLYSVLVTGQLGGVGSIPSRLDAGDGSGQAGGSRFENMQAPVVGGVEHYGWGLSGSKGSHYFFGGIGFADYTLSGQRSVVSLREENVATLPDRDKYLYYREIGTGNRWAISKHATANGYYEVFYQLYQDPRTAPVSGKAQWTFYQNARLVEDSRSQQQRSQVPEQGMAGGGFQPRQPQPQQDLAQPRLTTPAVPRQEYVQPAPRQYIQGPVVRAEQYVPAGRYVYVESGNCCGN